jgi:hypothetical protein
VYRRGRGSSIQEQTVGDNVGKLPWAAGTGNNLQGLSKRGQKPKEERAQRERRMSLYERRRRSNVLSGDGSRLPNGGNTRVGQRGSGHLAAFSVCLGGRLDKTGTHANDGPRGEAVGKPSVAGAYTNQRLNLSKPWEGTRRTCQGLEPDPGNLAVRDFRGASRNVRHGETVNPPCNRKSRTGNPSPTAGRARSLSQPRRRSAARINPSWRLPQLAPHSEAASAAATSPHSGAASDGNRANVPSAWLTDRLQLGRRDRASEPT